MLIPLPMRRRCSVHDNGNSCPVAVSQQCLWPSSSSSSSSSKSTSKIKKSNHSVYLSSSQDKYHLPVSALPTLADDSHALSGNDDFFGPVPSETEIHNALISLQQVFGSDSPTQQVNNTCYYKLNSEVGLLNTPLVDQVSPDGSETDWKEPSFSSLNPTIFLADASDKATFAIHLLQTDANVQRMVKSLSSDKSIWQALLNNEGVQELKNAITSERDRSSNRSINNDSPNTKNVMMRISDAIKAKLMEAVEKIIKIVNKFFTSAPHWEAVYAAKSNSFKRKLSISVMLSIMIFLIVVVGRMC